jgi:hypothetical protein
LLSELTTSFPNHPTAVIQPQMKLPTKLPTKPPTPTHETLNPPLAIVVKHGYLCGNYQHIVADSGDRVVVFAWTNNRAEAMAYNPRNKTVGRIPADLVKNEVSEPFADTQLYMTTSNESPSSLSHVKWKAGEYVRVWNRENHYANCEGLCFNVATGGIGKFHTKCSYLTLIN